MAVTTNTSLKEIKKEVRHLIDINNLNRAQSIYNLGQFFSAGEWALVECEIESNGYCLITNSIEDLLEK